MREKCDLCDINRGMCGSARWAALGISETADLLGTSDRTVLVSLTEHFAQNSLGPVSTCVFLSW